jgi:hypothetical protein
MTWREEVVNDACGFITHLVLVPASKIDTEESPLPITQIHEKQA